MQLLNQRRRLCFIKGCRGSHSKERGHHQPCQLVQRSASVEGKGNQELGNETTKAGMYRMSHKNMDPAHVIDCWIYYVACKQQGWEWVCI